jgi:hypothetical protein
MEVRMPKGSRLPNSNTSVAEVQLQSCPRQLQSKKAPHGGRQRSRRKFGSSSRVEA